MTLLPKKSTTKSRNGPPHSSTLLWIFFYFAGEDTPANTTNMRHKESIQKEGAADGAQRVKKKKKMEQNKPRS